MAVRLDRRPAALQPVEPRPAVPTLVTALTLVLVLVSTTGAWYVAAPVSLLAAGGLLWPRLRDRPELWWALVGFLAAGVHQVWTRADNHQYLIVYWVLAVAVAAGSHHPGRAMATAARVLLTAVFVLATVWKLANPAFVDGSFFEHTLLTDARFGPLATVVAGVPPDDLEANRSAARALTGAEPGASVDLLGHDRRLVLVADVLTWWTLALEGLVALAFLAPGHGRLGRRRDHLLLAFVATTYVVAPVLGFGWTLLVLGLAQCRATGGHLPTAYLVGFVVVRLGSTPLIAMAAGMADAGG